MEQEQVACSNQDARPRIYIDVEKCTGCGMCGEVCPFGLPVQGDDKKYRIERPELCTDCSACSRNCPEQAIIMMEKKGCGCLWDVARRRKNNGKNASPDSCCG
ncbi:MAG: ATP-binding protein [Candidatus Hodarchaeota archaeon]